MDLQTLIRKLELNESTISTALGGLVLAVVVLLLVNYFQIGRDDPISDSKEGSPLSSVSDDLKIEDAGLIETGGEVSATRVTKYLVKQGDSLWKIAEARYGDGYRWIDIARASEIEDADQIEIGDELDLPAIPEQIQPEKVEVTQVPDNYMVKRGDSLWDLALEFYGDNYRWVDVWNANLDQISNPDHLLVGQLLTLPD